MNDWFEVVRGGELEQGDLVPRCPIYRVGTAASGSGEVDAIEELHDVVVLTQTCDLENDKVDDVLLARVVSYEDLVRADGERNPHLRGKGFRKAAVDGNLPAQFLLPERVTPRFLHGRSWTSTISSRFPRAS